MSAISSFRRARLQIDIVAHSLIMLLILKYGIKKRYTYSILRAKYMGRAAKIYDFSSAWII